MEVRCSVMWDCSWRSFWDRFWLKFRRVWRYFWRVSWEEWRLAKEDSKVGFVRIVWRSFVLFGVVVSFQGLFWLYSLID